VQLSPQEVYEELVGLDLELPPPSVDGELYPHLFHLP